MTRVHVVLPGDVDDPRSPSGGNTYGRRVAGELAELGWTVARHRAPGSWPRPSAAEEARLARLLAAVPDGEVVLLDGLVACGVPAAVTPQAGRVRIVVLVHLPLAAEVGLAAEVAADLDARERATLRGADAIVVTSAAAARQLAADVPTPRPDAGPRDPGEGGRTGPDGGPRGGRGDDGDAGAEAGTRGGPGDDGGAGSDADPLGAGGGAGPRGGGGAGPGVPDRALPPVFVAEPGTDPAPAALGSDGASAVVCVAAVTPVKGHDVLVDALAEVADRPWTCVCAGPLDRTPEHVAEVRRRIERAGLVDRVRLVGPLGPTALDATYAGADLAVLASRTETYGMAAAEALARGLPVIATTGGGLPDTVGHAPDGTRPGLLVPPEDPAALAAALRRWFDEPDLRDQLRTAATARAASLPTWAATAEAVAAALVPGVPAPRRAPDHGTTSPGEPAPRRAPDHGTTSPGDPAPDGLAAASPSPASPSATTPGTHAPDGNPAAAAPSATTPATHPAASPSPAAPSATTPATHPAANPSPASPGTTSPAAHAPDGNPAAAAPTTSPAAPPAADAGGAHDGLEGGQVPEPRSSRDGVRPSPVRGAAK